MGHVIHTLKARAGIGALTFAAAAPVFRRGVTTRERVMKNMTLRAFAFVSALALASTPGHALSFDFSFTNQFGTILGTVTGHIDGLQDNATGPATAVFIDSAPPVFNLTFPFLMREGVANHLPSPPKSLPGLSFQVHCKPARIRN